MIICRVFVPWSLASALRGTRIAAMALGAFALAGVAFADAGIGDTRDSVLTMYGKPASTAKRGNREILLYPKGGRIELIDGRVTDVKGPLPVATPATAEAAAKPPSSASQSAPAAAATKKPVPPPAPEDNTNPATAANELAQHVEKMDTAWGAAPPRAVQRSALDSLPAFLAGLLLRFAIMIAALKLAFKYWEMDAFWSGIFAIAGIDLALHAILELLGSATGGFTTMAVVENGIPGLVLIYTVNRFCFNKRLHNAVLTAAAVKTIVTLCYVFVAVAALNAMFG